MKSSLAIVILCASVVGSQAQSGKHGGGIPDSLTPHVSLFLDTKQVHGRHSLLCMASFTDPGFQKNGQRFSSLRVNGGPLPSADSMSGEFPLSADSIPTGINVEFKDHGVIKVARVKLLKFPRTLPEKLSKSQLSTFLSSLQSSLAKDETMEVTISRDDSTALGAIPYEVQLTLFPKEIKIKMGSIDAVTTGKHEISASLESHTARQSAAVPLLYYALIAAVTEEIVITP